MSAPKDPSETDQQPQPEAQVPPGEVASETVDQRIGPALELLKKILGSIDEKRKKEQEAAETVQITEELQAQPEPVLEQNELFYVSMDGDHIGNEVMRAELTGDEQKISEVSSRIETGTAAFIQWGLNNAGKKIQSGGDEGMVKVPSLALDGIEAFRETYKGLVDTTVTIGVGRTIPESIKARHLGKLRGKNQVVYFDKNTEQELNLRLASKGEENEADKINEAIAPNQDEQIAKEYSDWQAGAK